jgi:hypothetical protein
MGLEGEFTRDLLLTLHQGCCLHGEKFSDVLEQMFCALYVWLEIPRNLSK